MKDSMLVGFGRVYSVSVANDFEDNDPPTAWIAFRMVTRSLGLARICSVFWRVFGF